MCLKKKMKERKRSEYVKLNHHFLFFTTHTHISHSLPLLLLLSFSVKRAIIHWICAQLSYFTTFFLLLLLLSSSSSLLPVPAPKLILIFFHTSSYNNVLCTVFFLLILLFLKKKNSGETDVSSVRLLLYILHDMLCTWWCICVQAISRHNHAWFWIFSLWFHKELNILYLGKQKAITQRTNT